MSKVLEATCLAGIVKVGQTPVPDTTVLSEGVGSSSGVLILEEDKKTYIAKTSPDLKSTLEQLEVALSQTATALLEVIQALGVVSAATIPPSTGGIASNVANITVATVQLNLAKSQVTTLKGMLK